MHPEFRETTIRHWERELELAYRDARAQDRGTRPSEEHQPRALRLTWFDLGGWPSVLASWRIAGS